uniref:Uncharacterized protein n=1 Tax=Arundo donax TaxID=35708 RepID=A0A0A9A721_ARUDO
MGEWTNKATGNYFYSRFVYR